jgi:tetratricopeptide (TPR) repeat protein
VAYGNSFAGPFVFDDQISIAGNSSIRHLATAWSPPGGQGLTVQGRPLLNVSLACNYALSGLNVGSYHVANLAIHLLAGLALFGILRRTLAPDQGPVAWVAALLWTVHPLQTEAVTYVVQRAESLMGLFYLGTLYFFIRWSALLPARFWLGPSSDPKAVRPSALGATRSTRFANFTLLLCALCCCLGMATKEVMVSAPIVLFLYDRTFMSGSFAAAWKAHARIYLALALSWLLLLGLVVADGGNRGGSVGFGTHLSWTAYWATQFPAIVRYLRLAFWPQGLVFDYGPFWITDPLRNLPAVLLVGALLIGTIGALRRHPRLGFLGAAFFCMLAPTSLLPGATQMIAEHRMYLPLAAIIIPVVYAGWTASARYRWLFWTGAIVSSVALVAATRARNATYRTELGLWQDTVAKRPANVTARNNYGNALKSAGRYPAAIEQYAAALRLEPGNPEVHNNLGGAFQEVGRPAEAIAEFQAAIRIEPRFAEAHNNLGLAWSRAGHPAEAMQELAAALAIRPDYPEAHANLGDALSAAGRFQPAAAEYQAALRLRPDSVETLNNLGNVLDQLGQIPEATQAYEAAAKLAPNDASVRFNLGIELEQARRFTEAAAEYERALQLAPSFLPARTHLEALGDRQGGNAVGAP